MADPNVLLEEEILRQVDDRSHESFDARLERVEKHVAMLVTAVNSIGEQTTWLCQSIDAAFKGFDQLQAEIAKSGPLGFFKMLKAGGVKQTEGGTENG